MPGETGHWQPAARLNQAFKKAARLFYAFNSQNPTLAFMSTSIKSWSNCMVFLLDVILNRWNIKIVWNDQESMWKDRNREVLPSPPNQPPAPFKANVSYNLVYTLIKIHLETALVSSCIHLLLHKGSFRTFFLWWFGTSFYFPAYISSTFPLAELSKPHFFQIKMISYFCSHAHRPSLSLFQCGFKHLKHQWPKLFLLQFYYFLGQN